MKTRSYGTLSEGERERVLRKRECWCEFPFKTEKRAFDENWLHNTFVALTSSQSVGGSGLCCFQLRLTSASAKCLLCVYQMMNARALTVFIFVLLFALENRVHTLRHKHRTHSQNKLSFSRILILSVDVLVCDTVSPKSFVHLRKSN